MPHHVAHAASAGLAAPHPESSVLVLDGRGEAVSHLAGRYAADGSLTVLASQGLPHSLGLLYEDVTEHLGFQRSSDEYKVMALASYGVPRHLPVLREAVRATGDGGFRTDPVAWDALAKRRAPGEEFDAEHADLAASVQARLEEVLLRAGPLAARADRRPGADHGRRGRAELRGQLPAGRRGTVRDGLGAAGRRRRRDRARRRPARGRGGGGAGRPDGRRRPRPGLDRRRARGLAGHRPLAVRAAGRPGRARSPRCWPPTGWWAGSPGAPSTARGRSGTARCWPTRAGGRP